MSELTCMPSSEVTERVLNILPGYHQGSVSRAYKNTPRSNTTNATKATAVPVSKGN